MVFWSLMSVLSWLECEWRENSCIAKGLLSHFDLVHSGFQPIFKSPSSHDLSAQYDQIQLFYYVRILRVGGMSLKSLRQALSNITLLSINVDQRLCNQSQWNINQVFRILWF